MLQQTLVWAVVCLGALGLCLWRPELGRVVLWRRRRGSPGAGRAPAR
jgi:hypothetical protein